MFAKALRELYPDFRKFTGQWRSEWVGATLAIVAAQTRHDEASMDLIEKRLPELLRTFHMKESTFIKIREKILRALARSKTLRVSQAARLVAFYSGISDI